MKILDQVKDVVTGATVSVLRTRRTVSP